MAASSPTTPTRPVRTGKPHTSVFLMNAIRALSTSESKEQRDKAKAQLEKEYKRSDQKLEELIAENHEALTLTMDHFSRVSTKLSACREKITTIKENLAASKNRLNCKRSELKKLWQQGIQHKQEMLLLDQIESLKVVPEKVKGYMTKKHYLHATELLVSSLNLLEGSLEGVEALKDIKACLQLKKQSLHKVLLDDLHVHLYVRSTSEVCRVQQRQGGTLRSSPFLESARKESMLSLRSSTSLMKRALDSGPSTPTHKLRQQQQRSTPSSGESVGEDVEEDLMATDPEEDSRHFMAIMVECLAQLNCIPSTVEKVKALMREELLSIARRAANQVSENAQPLDNGDSLQNQVHPERLLELLEILFEQYRCVALAHDCLLAIFNKAMNKHQLESQLYRMSDVWSQVQTVLELLLRDYLDYKNSSSNVQQASSFTETAIDIGSYFAKKRPIRPQKITLFRFDRSSHTIAMNSYLKEQKQGIYESPTIVGGGDNKEDETNKSTLVCRPDAKNVIVIFNPVMKFIGEIEAALGYSPEQHCYLHVFLMDFVKQEYMFEVHEELAVHEEVAKKSLDAWKIGFDLDSQKGLDSPRQLLESTISTDHVIQWLHGLIQNLPPHAEHLVLIIWNLMDHYKETCITAYSGIVNSESETQILSHNWAEKEKVLQHLRSLWTLMDGQLSEKEANLKSESDLLAYLLLNTATKPTIIGNHEILNDVAKFRVLALFQQSMDWFGEQISKFATNLPGDSHPKVASIPLMEIPPVADDTIQSLKRYAQDFHELSEMSLFVLHLEVRVHCFYYLAPLADKNTFASSVESQDPDQEVVKLNRDLSNIEEALSSFLQAKSFRFVFEGLGHVMANIFINCAQHIKCINTNGIKKMCRNIFAVQQNLMNITMARQDALDQARQYYELMYNNTEDILNIIVDQGPQFTELEYMTMLQLLHRSTISTIIEPTTNVNIHIERLKEIISEFNRN